MFRYLSLPALAMLVLGCPCLGPSPFVLHVTPEEITDAIPDQHCVLLVSVEECPLSRGLTSPVHITASAPGATVLVENADILPGEIAEVSVIPAPLEGKALGSVKQEEGRIITATICASGGCSWRMAQVPINIRSEEEDLVGPLAVEMRDLFIPWLAENQPELGITEETEWTGTIVTPHILIVTHYLYFSDEWEMHVFWHVMIPPHDWARIELRRRFEETTPSLAFEISSRSADPPLEPIAIEPSDTLWR